MKSTSLRIITFGVFDMLHFGHLRLFQKIKKQFGENCFLIVCVQSSENIKKYKPDSKILYSTDERVQMIKSLKCVDDVLIYDDVNIDIKEVEFDIWAKGPDQVHEGFQDAVRWCDRHNKKVYTIPRTEGISSSFIKNMVNDFSSGDK